MFSAKQVANETWNSKTVLATTSSETLSAFLSPLRSGTRYEVRVLVIDEDGHHREHGASSTHFQTACGAPAFPPQILKIDKSSPSAIVIKWTNPPRESWNCWSVNVVLEVDGVPKEFNLTESGTIAQDMYSIPVTPYTTVNIRLRLRTPDNNYSAWTKNMTVVSAEDAPTEPAYVVLRRNGSTEVEVAWGCPKLANGVIRHYRVLYKPLRLRVPHCALRSQQETEVTVPPTLLSANLTGLHPYTTYRVSVAAVTVSPGKAAEVTFDTLEAAPLPPADLRADQQSLDRVSLSWDAPYPPHGVLQGYRLQYWKSGDRRSVTTTEIVHGTCKSEKAYTPRHCYTVTNLHPNVIYHFSV
ncbi:hypothetical protein V5799_002992 [Amblyomma americanum]|uniref:Fibronectin type-III domain-containing protein n=1 Tax=Amblyomma americanum TaxID=6943 RepID=A0AAQ4DA86_AMBAM